MINRSRRMVLGSGVLGLVCFVGCAPMGQDTPQATLRKYQRSIVEGNYREYLECLYPRGWKWDSKVHKGRFAIYRASQALKAALLTRYGPDGIKKYFEASEDYRVSHLQIFPDGYSWIDKLSLEMGPCSRAAQFGHDEEAFYSGLKGLPPLWEMIKKDGSWYVSVLCYPDGVGYEGVGGPDDYEREGDERRLSVVEKVTAEILQKGISPRDAFIMVGEGMLEVRRLNSREAECEKAKRSKR